MPHGLHEKLDQEFKSKLPLIVKGGTTTNNLFRGGEIMVPT